MSDINEAANKLRTLAPMFRKFAEVGEILDRVGALDNAEAEAKARLEKMREEEQRERARLDALSEECEKAKGDVAALIFKATTEAQELKRDATEAIAAWRAEAQADIDQAEAAAKASREKAEAASKARAADLDAIAASKRAANDAMDVALEAKRKELADLETRIGNARAAMQKMLG